MITAKEARERIDALEAERESKEKEMAEEKITAAVERGEASCWLVGCISKATEDWLRSMGYIVQRTDDLRDGSYLEVAW